MRRTGLALATQAELSWDVWSVAVGLGGSACVQLRNVLSKPFPLQVRGYDGLAACHCGAGGRWLLLLRTEACVAHLQGYHLHQFLAAGSSVVTIPLFAARQVLCATSSDGWLRWDGATALSLAGAGALYFVYTALSLLVLGRVSPTSHAVLKSCQRLVVVVAALVYTQSHPRCASYLPLI